MLISHMHATRRDSLGNAITQENNTSFHNTCPLDDIPQNNKPTPRSTCTTAKGTTAKQKKPKPTKSLHCSTTKLGHDTGPNQDTRANAINQAAPQGQTKKHKSRRSKLRHTRPAETREPKLQQIIICAQQRKINLQRKLMQNNRTTRRATYRQPN